jgi:hypothetical protein
VVAVTEGAFTDAQFPAAPYPGARPSCSFVHDDGVGRPLLRAGDIWRIGPDDVDLDHWLTDRGAPPLAERVALLAYGSNACPAKITWLREHLGLPGPAVVLRARCHGFAAVWAAGRRVVDEQRPATLAAWPGAVEDHAVWLATPEQLAVLDVCEGRGVRYRLVRLRTGRVELEDGPPVEHPLAYVGLATIRHPLLVDAAVVRCADVGQSAALRLVGVAATSDGLDVDPVPSD